MSTLLSSPSAIKSTYFQKESVTAAAALAMINRAETHAKNNGLTIATTVVDESGVPKAFSRMDGAPLIAVDASRQKAVTAVGFGLPTGKPWQDFVADDPILEKGVHDLEDFILLGGGAPILIDGTLVGAIGVSGGHYRQDEACVAAALKEVA